MAIDDTGTSFFPCVGSQVVKGERLRTSSVEVHRFEPGPTHPPLGKGIEPVRDAQITEIDEAGTLIRENGGIPR